MELEALAKIGMPAARTTALNSVHRNGAKVVSEELEVEGGCLIYSFDIKIPGQRSIIEVAIDAGSGNVLAQKREGPKAQAAEAAADKAVSTAK